MINVSIVLPTYNGEKYIRESIDSIRNQTMQNWELIIVNDCSTDNTLQIIQHYVAMDTRIKLINNKKNQKLPNALNIGFKVARGKYLTWTSDDNYYEPMALEVLSNALERNSDTYLVYSAMNIIDDNGKRLYVSNTQNCLDFLFCYNMIGASFMYRREALEDIGQYSPELFLVEDYDYWLRIYEQYGKVVHISQILYNYRIHEESLSETKKKQVEKQLKKLKVKHLPVILEKNKEKKDCIYRIYYELLKHKFNQKWLDKLFYQYMPELRFEENGCKNIKKVFVFGAGKVGKEALSLFGDRVISFVDNDKQKIGNTIDNIPVISFDEMVKCQNERDDITVIVAVSELYIYEIVQQMIENNVKKFCSLMYYRNIM